MLLTNYHPQRTLNKTLFDFFADDVVYKKTAWQPAIDINESDQAYTLVADVPGVGDDNLDISAEKNVLTIEGKREFDRAETEQKARRVERIAGEFTRRFTLPDNADIDNISANKKDGVLIVEIPKKAKEAAKQIAITVS